MHLHHYCYERGLVIAVSLFYSFLTHLHCIHLWFYCNMIFGVFVLVWWSLKGAQAARFRVVFLSLLHLPE